jgi:hypothetical protein
MQRLDIDEYEAQQYQIHDPATYQAGWAALHQLEVLAQSGQAPFDIKDAV